MFLVFANNFDWSNKNYPLYFKNKETKNLVGNMLTNAIDELTQCTKVVGQTGCNPMSVSPQSDCSFSYF